MVTSPDQTTLEVLVGEPTTVSRRIKIFVSAAALIAALGYLGFTAFEGATVYFYTVSELKDIGPTKEGRMVRVSGKLIHDSFTREDDSTFARFTLRDKGSDETLSAVHQGVVPDLFFNKHSEIILDGRYTPQETFESHNVIVKCPSKYVADD